MAFGIIGIVLFAVGWIVFGWLNYIGLVLGIIGIAYGAHGKKAARVLGIIATVLCSIGSVYITVYYIASSL